MKFIQNTKRFFVILATSLVIASASCSAKAQEVQQVPFPAICSSFQSVTKELQDKYQEQPILVGDSEGKHIVYWLNPRSGSFTITVSNQEIMCVIASGDNAKPFVEKQSDKPVDKKKQI